MCCLCFLFNVFNQIHSNQVKDMYFYCPLKCFHYSFGLEIQDDHQQYTMLNIGPYGENI